MEQRSGIFALRHQRAGDAQAIRAAQHQQHALGAAEMRCFVDQRLVQGVAVAKCVQAQAGVDQALNELARRRRVRGAQVVQFNAPGFVPCLCLRAVLVPSEPWPAGCPKLDRRPDLSHCLGGLTSTPVGGGVLRLARVRLRCSCSPCLANGCIRGAGGSRFDTAGGDAPDAPASPQCRTVWHGTVRKFNRITCGGEGSRRGVASACGAGEAVGDVLGILSRSALAGSYMD